MASADYLYNSLDPDQARQNVGPDLDLNCLKLMVFLKFFLKINFEKKNRTTFTKHAKNVLEWFFIWVINQQIDFDVV